MISKTPNKVILDCIAKIKAAMTNEIRINMAKFSRS